jgi:hypothetical protein
MSVDRRCTCRPSTLRRGCKRCPLIRPVKGMSAGFFEDDDAAPTGCSALVVPSVSVGECPTVSEIGDVGTEHQSVGSGASVERDGFEQAHHVMMTSVCRRRRTGDRCRCRFALMRRAHPGASTTYPVALRSMPAASPQETDRAWLVALSGRTAHLPSVGSTPSGRSDRDRWGSGDS